MRKAITCPLRGCLAEIVYEDSPESSRILGVMACSLLDEIVDCDQECVRRMNIKLEDESNARLLPCSD